MRLSLFDPAHFKEPVGPYLQRDLTTLRAEQNIDEALAEIRRRGVAERIIYFYVVDGERRLLGVVPTRRLLGAPLDASIESIMVRSVISLREDSTLFEVLEAFHAHRLLALPAVDAEGRLQGAIDLGAVSQDLFSAEARFQADAVFEAIGLELGRIRDLSSARATLLRLRWLLLTMGSGLVCALLAAGFEKTLAAGTSIAFFIALVLAMGESASMQTMTLTLQALHGVRPKRRWFLLTLWREIRTAVPLGLLSGLLAGGVVLAWRRESAVALALGSAVALSVVSACLVGLAVPTVVHALGLDYKIASSPATLAIADVLSLTTYFLIAAAVIA